MRLRKQTKIYFVRSKYSSIINWIFLWYTLVPWRDIDMVLLVHSSSYFTFFLSLCSLSFLQTAELKRKVSKCLLAHDQRFDHLLLPPLQTYREDYSFLCLLQVFRQVSVSVYLIRGVRLCNRIVKNQCEDISNNIRHLPSHHYLFHN